MKSNRYQPISSQAEITGKVIFDLAEASEREANLADSMMMANSYVPDGNVKESLKIYQGEIVIGRRKAHRYTSFTGNVKQAGLSSLSGLYYGNHVSRESLLKDFYFIGIAKDNYEYGGDNMWHDDPLDHGIGVVMSGSVSTWNGPYDVYAGDLMMLEFPPLPSEEPGRGKKTTYPGTQFSGKPVPYLVPFDRGTCRPQIEAIMAAMNRSSADIVPGIQNLTADDLETNEYLTPLQEEALAFQNAFAKLEGNFGKEGVLTELCDAVASTVMSRVQRIVGRAIDDAKPNGTLNIMLSHYKVA